MSDDITFEDGRCCSLASSLHAWILEQSARCTPPALSLWLNDLAKRPNGLMSFDVRGLAPNSRAEFYAALERASLSYLTGPEQDPHESRALRAWHKLMDTYNRSKNRLPAVDELDARRCDWDGERIDIRLLWFCPSCERLLAPKPDKACDECGWQHPDKAVGG